MRALGIISTGVALFGILAFFLLRNSAPDYTITIIIVSSVLAVFFFLVGMIVDRSVGGKKVYQCLNCGAKVKGGNPVKIGRVCPNCGGNAFA